MVSVPLLSAVVRVERPVSERNCRRNVAVLNRYQKDLIRQDLLKVGLQGFEPSTEPLDGLVSASMDHGHHIEIVDDVS